MIQDLINDVRLFHQTFGHPILTKPAIPSPERQVLRNKLLRDEWLEELDPAWARCAAIRKAITESPPVSPQIVKEAEAEALAEFGDAIADVIYFLIGTALEYGIPLDQIWAAVQEANMSKLWTGEEVWSHFQNLGSFPDRSIKLTNGWRAVMVEKTPYHRTDTYIVYDETGKVRKPPSWKEPDIKGIIRKAMQ